MQRDHFISLLDKYTSDTITPQEQGELFELIALGEYDALLEAHFPAGFDAQPGIPVPRADATARPLPGLAPLPESRRRVRILPWAVAASVLLLGAACYLFAHRALTASAGDKPLALRLKDGSHITLQPHSSLRYAPGKRDVRLEGEAFFDIARDPAHPFLVHYDHLVTQVLGTSFRIKTDREKQQAEVTVVTGKVWVYDEQNKGIILTPNQKVTYSETDRSFTAGLAGEPVPVSPSAGLVFQNAPLPQVLRRLGTLYGIDMTTANTHLDSCLFSGDIGPYDLYTKLGIICQSLHATYTITGTRILIQGKGCGQ
jgi:ferric-dicitrate binding protein FerR (iron transport regulator)